MTYIPSQLANVDEVLIQRVLFDNYYLTCTIWYVILCVLFCLLNIDEFYEYHIKCNTLQVSCTLIFLDLMISNRSKIPKNSWNLYSLVRYQRWLNLPFLPCLSTTAHLYQTPQFSYNFYSNLLASFFYLILEW